MKNEYELAKKMFWRAKRDKDRLQKERSLEVMKRIDNSRSFEEIMRGVKK